MRKSMPSVRMEGVMMSLSCLVYIAKISPSSDHAHLHQHKDLNTRIYARERITGLLMVAGGFLFEIMEGEYATLESNLDRVSATPLMNTPDILIFTALAKRQFQAWKMGTLEPNPSISTDLSVFHMLGEQTQSDPSSTPAAALQMLKLFHEQFANHPPHSNAA